jgi:hypothetical protein
MVITVPVPGTQSMRKLSPALSFFTSEKIWLMRITPGMSEENRALSMLSSMPRENILPSSEASMSRSMVTFIRLGPGAASTSSGVPAFLLRYRPAVYTLNTAL